MEGLILEVLDGVDVKEFLFFEMNFIEIKGGERFYVNMNDLVILNIKIKLIVFLKFKKG